MSAQHTPAPWFHNLHGNTVDQAVPNWRELSAIAVCVSHGTRTPAEAIANATLIAAAPEMYEAGKSLLQYEGHHAWCGHGEDPTKPCKCGLLDAQNRLRAAIAKADGWS